MLSRAATMECVPGPLVTTITAENREATHRAEPKASEDSAAAAVASTAVVAAFTVVVAEDAAKVGLSLTAISYNNSIWRG